MMRMWWEAGEEIDGYRIESVVHSGGMATIYRVEPLGAPSEFPLVMKLPRLGHGDDPVSVVSYEVEQMMLGALRGPHVPRLVAVGDLDRQPYLVMEFIDGETLQHAVERAPLDVAEVVTLIAAVADAIDDLHCQHVAHLDIKPSNIMFRDNGEAVLIDLGLAHHSHFPDLLAEEFRKPIGSAPYMAPEQVLGMRSDPRSDIFALGAVLYQLVTGVLPFGTPTSVRGLRQRLYRYARAPRALRGEIPPWLQEVILHCLDAEAARRPSARAVAAWLRQPERVTVTVRGKRTRNPGWGVRFKRWLWATGFEPKAPDVDEPAAETPIVLVPVAQATSNANLVATMQDVVRKVAASDYTARIAIATVIPPTPLFGNSSGESGGSAHLRHLVELRQWAEPLQLPQSRLTFHVLEAADVAHALVDFAQSNPVRQIVIGAPPARSIAKLGSSQGTEAVAARVSLQAPCTVVLVRPESR